MKSLLAGLTFAAALVSVGRAQETGDFRHWYADWSVQQAVNDAQLILVAKVTHVGQLKVVEGAKTDKYFREFRFQPIRQLKGVYSRGELVMSASDLGCASSTGAAANDLREGQLRILMLSQSNPAAFGLGGLPSFGCVTAPNSKNFRQSVPLLSGEDDPIIPMFETMCRLANLRSRRARAESLVERLDATEGPAAVPLLAAVRRDAMWAAANSNVVEPLVRLAGDERAPIRTEAVRTIASVLTWSRNAGLPTERLGQAVREFLVEGRRRTADRVLAIQSLADLDGDEDWRTELLLNLLRESRSYEERFAAAKVLGGCGDQDCFEALATELADLPLDAAKQHLVTLASALLKVDPEAAAELLIDRFRESLVAGQPVSGELKLFTDFAIRESIGEILVALETAPLSTKNELVAALGRLEAEAAIPHLSDLLDSWPQTAVLAKQALLQIGTQEAAVALRSHLKTEADLTTKLRIAALLAEFGFDDGYALAIEHLADRTDVSLLAARVLGAIGAERTQKQLAPLLASDPDPHWFAAALAGLLAVDDPAARAALLRILEDDRHPIIVKAVEFAHLANDEAVAPPLVKLMESRNGALALAALRAQGRIIRQDGRIAQADGDTRLNSAVVMASVSRMNQSRQDDLSATLRRVLSDSYIDSGIRAEALSVLELFSTEELSETLLDLLDRPELEGSKLAARMERLIRERDVPLP